MYGDQDFSCIRQYIPFKPISFGNTPSVSDAPCRALILCAQSPRAAAVLGVETLHHQGGQRSNVRRSEEYQYPVGAAQHGSCFNLLRFLSARAFIRIGRAHSRVQPFSSSRLIGPRLLPMRLLAHPGP